MPLSRQGAEDMIGFHLRSRIGRKGNDLRQEKYFCHMTLTQLTKIPPQKSSVKNILDICGENKDRLELLQIEAQPHHIQIRA